MKRILVKRRASLGDVLNTTPVVRRLRRENIDAWIQVATDHPHAYENNPHIQGTQSQADETYDEVIDLNLCFEQNRRIHQVDANLQRAFGDTSGDKSICLSFGNFDANFPWDKTVVVHPNITWAQRTIPHEWWLRTIALLEAKGFFVLITGTSRDWPIEVESGLNFQDKFPLSGQAAMIHRSAAFLTGASGLVTVCGATDAPMVVLGTMTPWENWVPFRHGELGWNAHELRTPLGCYGCDADEPESEYYECPLGTNACVQTFNSQDAVDMVEKAIATDRRKGG